MQVPFFNTHSPYLDRAALKGRNAIVEQMADDLRAGSASAGAITEGDMRRLGWTADQISLHGEAAADRARALAAGR